MRIERALVIVFLLMAAIPAAAQFHVYPGKTVGALCSTCLAEIKDKPTWPYNDPLIAHTGRYVDSSTTLNVQHIGMRTVRADAVRVNPDTGRLYIRLGEAVGGYSLDNFFTSKLANPLVPVSVMKTGAKYGRYGEPLERVAEPDTFFYSEASSSGWAIQWLDAQVVLSDFDSDDRGYVYIASLYWGWGIAQDDGRTTGGHMGYVVQMRNLATQPDTVTSFKTGGRYYAVVASSARTNASHSIYDVMEPGTPRLLTVRTGIEDGIVKWSRFDASSRLAVLSADGHVRIFDYASLIDTGEPLADYAPALGHKFADLTYDESGTLWIAESSSSLATNTLWQVTAEGAAFTTAKHNVYGSTFIPEKIAAGSGYVAVGGKAAVDGVSKTELRLLRLKDGVPELLPTGNFFRFFYHAAPAGYVSASSYVQSYTSLYALRIVEAAGRTYLMYSAAGLGDVFELEKVVVPKKIGTTIALASSAGSTTLGEAATFTATVSPESAGAVPPGGNVTFKRDGIAVGTVPLTVAGSSHQAAVTLTDLLPGSHEITASYSGDAAYAASVATPVTHVVSQLLVSVEATAVGPTSVRITWPALPGIQYSIMRSSATGVVPVLAQVIGGEYTDNTVSPGNVYLYRVNAIYLDGSLGPLSAADAASTMAFTDEELLAGTPVKACHMTELRVAANSLRAAAGLPPIAFDSIATGGVVHAYDLSGIHAAINQARALLGILSLPDVPLVSGVTTIRRDEVVGLRSAVK